MDISQRAKTEKKGSIPFLVLLAFFAILAGLDVLMRREYADPASPAHNMTNQMINPAAQINKDVSMMCAREESAEQMVSLAENIQKNGDTITKLLNDLIDMSEEDMRKEDAYEED